MVWVPPRRHFSNDHANRAGGDCSAPDLLVTTSIDRWLLRLLGGAMCVAGVGEPAAAATLGLVIGLRVFSDDAGVDERERCLRRFRAFGYFAADSVARSR